ncbi:MAG: MerR family transcriptional regulator [Ignavibacteriales bacterium]
MRRDRTNGYRLYSDTDLGRIAVIRVLRQARYSTMFILRMLQRLDRGETDGLREALNTPRSQRGRVLRNGSLAFDAPEPGANRLWAGLYPQRHPPPIHKPYISPPGL